MSVQRHRDAWKVRWRENDRHRARVFKRKGDADTFDREVKRRQALGPHLMRELDRSALTLDDFVRGGFRSHAATLAAPTRAKHAWALELHLAELLDEPLAQLDVPRLVAHQEHLLTTGRTASTVREVLTRLSGVLQIATPSTASSPATTARAMRKIPADTVEDVRPLAPTDLEALITSLTGRDRALVLLAGHLGLRPLEVRTVPSTPRRVHPHREPVADEEDRGRTRVIDVPAITARELRAWQLESGGRGDNPIAPMTAEAMKSWTRRTLPPDTTLYRLRHTHASLLHYCGYTVPEAAERMGHGPGLHVETYAHVIQADPWTPLRRPRRAHHRCARRAGCSQRRPRRGDRERRRHPWTAKTPVVAGVSWEALYRTRTDDPFLTMEVLYQLS